MALDCYDFDSGQCRHFPDGTYRAQAATGEGRTELELMRLLRRCWVVFKHKKLDEGDMDDQKFAYWIVAASPKNDGDLNRVIKQLWQLRAA